MSYSPFADDFLDMLTQVVTLASYGARDDYGDETWGPPRTYRARISGGNTAVYTASGEMIVGRTTILIHPQATDGTVLTTLGAEPDNAKLTLPDGTTPRLLSIGPEYDEAGIVYWKAIT